MQFLKLATFLSAAAMAAAANTVTFVSQDSTERTIYFTANPGSSAISTIVVPGKATVTVSIPHAWQGNWYAVSKGATNVPGMLGEVAFNSWGGITFYDVSAIVNPNDKNGVKKLYPASTPKTSLSSTTLTSGCDLFPCNNAYYLPDDVQTKTTQETDLICTLGSASSTSARSPAPEADAAEEATAPVFTREWVMGKWTPHANAI
ncbi:hypothetical protein GQ53DRAFT_826095 [Thozetella sp. PMI_491]|nr:hypothetical protein GQ53DRAFT_826095 [Thozetella sp. PMI_491]